MTAYDVAMQDLRHRLAKAEEWALTMKHHGDQIDGLLERVGQFEEQLCLLGLLDCPEMTRVKLWHATRDKVLPAIYTESLNHSMTVAEVLHDAAAYADAAHGPLVKT